MRATQKAIKVYHITRDEKKYWKKKSEKRKV